MAEGMSNLNGVSAQSRAARGAAVLLSCFLSACGPAPIPSGDSVVDRDEAQNREVHRFNVGVDRYVLSPVADAYGNVV
ncbi:MAG: MlaA family lipoprotein, partial [Alphaproteobacteria bacterium]|nr:MlaA family lipoprotein [Alphaproteobacteria bacterium]